MDTGVMIAIAVAVILVIAVLVMLARSRGSAKQRKAEREILKRREAAAGRHQTEAQERALEAQRLEHEARAQRLEAEAQGERAALHQRGLADQELVRSDESDLRQHLDSDRLRGQQFESGSDPIQNGRDANVGGGRFERTRDVSGGRAHEPAPEFRDDGRR